MATLIQLRKWKAEAEVALHSLALGDKVVSVSSPDGTITYNQSSMPKLREYMAYLDAEIGVLSTGSTRRPIVPLHGIN